MKTRSWAPGLRDPGRGGGVDAVVARRRRGYRLAVAGIDLDRRADDRLIVGKAVEIDRQLLALGDTDELEILALDGDPRIGRRGRARRRPLVVIRPGGDRDAGEQKTNAEHHPRRRGRDKRAFTR